MMTAYEQERRVALRAVAAANRIARTIQNDFLSSDTDAIAKADASPVTVADFAVQALVVAYLHSAFPNDLFIAEESTSALKADSNLRSTVANASGLSEERVLNLIDLCSFDGSVKGRRVWVLDPIDGTKGFIQGRQYCVALGLVDDGSVALGVLGCPNLTAEGMKELDFRSITDDIVTGYLFHAVRGNGSWMLGETDIPEISFDADISMLKDNSLPMGEQCYVSSTTSAIEASICESVESAHSRHEISAKVSNLLGVKNPSIRMDSQAKYGCMARGDVGIFLRFPKDGYVENIWDSAPACIVIEEAGGKVTDGRGRALNFSLGRKLDNDDGIVATNGKLHETVIAAVQKAMSEMPV